jgi:hypothetical protein
MPVAFDQPPQPAASAPAGAPVGAPVGDARSRLLPGSGAVRPEAEQQYDRAAHWIHQPGA